MTDQDDDQPLIRNEDTLHRRAWIDRALAGVRQRLIPADPPGEPAATPAAPAVPAAEAPTPTALAPEGSDATRPRLYLVGGNDHR